MRIAACLLFLTMISASPEPSLFAQDAAQPTVSVSPAPAPPTPPPAESLSTPALPELSALDQAFNQTGFGKEADEMRTRVEMRKLQNAVAREPAVIEARTAADKAPTDLERRNRLREYYELNYGLMSKRASSSALKAAIEKAKGEKIASLGQPRVRPQTGPHEPTPQPTPKKKKHKKSGKRF